MKKETFEKIKNWWWYHKIHVLIGVLALAVVIYSFAQSSGKDDADYHIGLLLAVPCTEEYLNALPELLAAAGEDINGDGEVKVELHTYFVDLADERENAGALNYETIASLEADLIGKTSAMFITDSHESLMSLTEGIFSDAIPFDGYRLCVRVDADARYTALANELTN